MLHRRLAIHVLWSSICLTQVVLGAEGTPALGQGTMSGEITHSSALLQARLTDGVELNQAGDLLGSEGYICFEWSENEGFSPSLLTAVEPALPRNDFIVRAKLSDLSPDTLYFYRARYGASPDKLVDGPMCSFRTHAGRETPRDVSFIVGSCMNYCKFMYGKRGNAGGPVTATAEDKRLGFPAFETMLHLRPEFFVGTGDIVYYDNPFRRSETLVELRRCWHEQFRFPRMKEFFRTVPTYWSKDDHDFRYNDSDNTSTRLPVSKTGIELFREQLPLAPQGVQSPNYRTHRVSKGLQIWLTEGRDHRSPNAMPDGPLKSLWGREQLLWLKRTLKESDATWKLLISPTPLVGPDMAKKSDNHTSLRGFRHEADGFLAWIQQNEIKNFVTMCGDRHWQYHSIHPSGLNEFACGALNDENARLGIAPGDQDGTDPGARIVQPFRSVVPSGGFLQVEVGNEFAVNFFNDEGTLLHTTRLIKE